MPRVLEYLELARDEIAALDRETTLFVSVVAPIEVHGGHLPVGTDLYVAEGILRRTVEQLDGWTVVRLPDLLLGAQAIPARGSIRIKAKVLESALESWGMGLAELGFRYWIVFDNHGGVTHQLAEATAAARLLRKGFNLIIPFVSIFHDMTWEKTGLQLKPGCDGGAEDAHAGTNETSLMLALSPHRIRPGWENLPRWKPARETVMGKFGRLLKQPLLGMAMDWFAAPDNPHYVGGPADAAVQAGYAMAEYHEAKSLELLNAARNGTYRSPRPYPLLVAAISKLFE